MVKKTEVERSVTVSTTKTKPDHPQGGPPGQTTPPPTEPPPVTEPPPEPVVPPIVIVQPPIVTPPDVGTQLTWKPLKIGAGGFVTGIDIASDGTKVIRTDVGNGYVWTGSVWTPLVTAASMGMYFGYTGSAGGSYNDGGVYAVKIAPSVPTRFYMHYQGRMFRSDDRGAAWTFCSGWTPIVGDYANKIAGTDPLIAIDPANPDVVYSGTSTNGLFVTTDGGTTWTSLSPSPIALSSPDPQAYCICFDPSSAVSGGRTQGIYVSAHGTGVYHSTDAGAHWTLTTGTPTSHIQMAISSTGVVWLTDPSGAQRLRKYSGGTWTNPSIGGPGATAITIALVSGGTTIYIGSDGGDICTSSDSGVTWTPTSTLSTRTATDIPWLGWTTETYMTNCGMKWDATSSRLYFAEGIGVWYSTNPGPATIWTSQSAGIEELVGNMVLRPPGGKPICCAWDRPLFYSADQDVYPSTHGPNRDHSIIMGFHCDYAAANPTFLVALVNYSGVGEESGYSSDGGQTWTNFAGDPGLYAASKTGGSIAAGSTTSYVWVPSNNGRPYYTTNSGTSWTPVSISGVPTTGETGWGSNWRVNRHIVCADRVNANTFYAYNNGTINSDGAGTNADGLIAGVYRSTDSGATWTKRFVGRMSSNDSTGYSWDNYAAILRTVPGNAGHLFYSAGNVGGGVVGPFHRSTDGGVTWTNIPGVLMVKAFGFGKAQSGGYPAVYIAGWVGGTGADKWGIYRSDNGDQVTPTWTKIIDYPTSWRTAGNTPTGNHDFITWVEGDTDVFGKLYVAFQGTGFAYYG